jgi:hypothetical protein
MREEAMHAARLSFFVVAMAASPLAGADWLDDFNRNCLAKGGTPVHNAGGGGYCKPGPGAGAGGANPYGAMAGSFADMINQIDAANDAAARQKRAAVMQALETERRDALRRQETMRAANLAAIQQRLMDNALGVKESGNELQLKLGDGAASRAKPAEYGLPGRHIFRNDIFVDGATPTPTERIASSLLTLKLGDQATESLRSEPSSSTAPAARPAAGGATQGATRTEELKAWFGQLTPEAQGRIIAAGAAATARTSDAVPSDAPLESLKERGIDEPRSGGVALRDLEPLRPQPPRPPTAPLPSVAASSATATTLVPAQPAPIARPSPASSPTTNRAANVQAPAPSDGGLLFRDVTNPAPPRITDDRDLLDSFQRASTPEARKRAQDAHVTILGLAVMPDDPIAGGFRTGDRQRRVLVAHFAPELMQRYENDPRFAAEIDFMIDRRVAQARKWRSDADRDAQQVLAAAEARDVQRENAVQAQLMLQEALQRDLASLRR